MQPLDFPVQLASIPMRFNHFWPHASKAQIQWTVPHFYIVCSEVGCTQLHCKFASVQLAVEWLLQIDALTAVALQPVHLFHSLTSSFSLLPFFATLSWSSVFWSSATFILIIGSLLQVLNEAVGALMWHTIQLTKEVDQRSSKPCSNPETFGAN